MIRRYIVRSAHGPLRPLWHACYATVLRAITLSLVLADRHASVYVAGSIGRGEPAFGLSDLDLLVITPADPAHPGKRRKRLAEHAHRIERLAPGPHRSSLEIGVCEPGELRRAVAATVFTRPTPGLLTDAGWRIVAGLQERPGVGDPLGRWRKLAGPAS